MHKAASLIVFMAATVSFPLAAVARSPYRPSQAIVAGAPLEAKGCYYYRGRRTCGSYCYWEVNGHRYCQTRDHDAYPQAELRIEKPEGRPIARRVRAAHRVK